LARRHPDRERDGVRRRRAGARLAAAVGDASGTAMIRGKKSEVHTLYFIPAEGSIAVVHLPIGGADAKPVEAVVERPEGALRIVVSIPTASRRAAASSFG